MNMDYFDFATSLRMTDNKNGKCFSDCHPGPETSIVNRMNLALAIQQVTELCMMTLAETAKKSPAVKIWSWQEV
jgi:hypothetical protein